MRYRFIKVILTLCCFFIQYQAQASWLSDLVPPWGRDDGRHGCILSNYEKPGDFAFFQHKCAEPVQNINFFTPQVTVRLQDCNAVWCMGFSETLNGDGQCMMRPGPLIVPLVRICARIAVPADTSNNVPQDPGYTPGVSLVNGVMPIPASMIAIDPNNAGQVNNPQTALPSPIQGASNGTNYYGITLKDPVIIGADGTPITAQHPKLCTYYDPWMLELMDPATIPFFDPMDYNPIKQPFQTGSGVSPIAKAIIDFVKFGEGALSDTIIGGPYGPLAGAAVKTFAASRGGILNTIVSFVPKVIDFIGKHTFIALLKYFGQFNKIVYDSLGCVNLSLGPFPPPYNPQITVPSPSGVVESVCVATNPASKSPTTDNPCALSVLRNNPIHNTVRVGFHTLLPFCSSLSKNPDGSSQTTSTANCCTFSFSGTMTASSVHGALTNDMIPNCAHTTGGGICVNVPTSITGTQFRVRYGMQYVNVVPNDFYDVSQTNDCLTPEEGMCQRVLGIDTGNFVDIAISFPAIENSYDTTALTSTQGLVNNDTSSGTDNMTTLSDYVGSYVGFYTSDPTLSTATITDPAGVSRTFYTSITRTQDGGQDPSMVCVYEEVIPGTINAQFDNIVGCIARAPAPQPSVFNCGYNSVFCANNNGNDIFAPQFVVALESGTDSTMGPLSVNSVNTNNGIKDSSNNQTINLAGFDYTAFVTDNYNNEMPFSGSHAYGAASRFGNYLPYTLEGVAVSGSPVPPLVSPPLQGIPEIPTGAIYLSGLEYQNGEYSKGGDYICVSNNTTQMSPCSPQTTENCVLTQLLNTQVVQCSQIASKMQTYQSLNPCDPTLPNHCPSGTTATIDSTLPAFCSNFTTAEGCTDTLNFYKCTPTNGGNNSYCYALNSGNTIPYVNDSSQLCQITYNPKYRIEPKYEVNTDVVDCNHFNQIINPYPSITSCANSMPNPCPSYTVPTIVGSLPAYCSNFSTAEGCTDTLNVYQCITPEGGASSFCYAMQSGNPITYAQDSTQLCQQPNQQDEKYQAAIIPNTGGPGVSYFDFGNQQRMAQAQIQNIANAANDIEQCSLYLSHVYNAPYTNVQQCTTSQLSYTKAEYYISTNTNTTLNILGNPVTQLTCKYPNIDIANCPAADQITTTTTDYCYTFTVSNGGNAELCQLSKTTTTRYAYDGSVLPTTPDIEACSVYLSDIYTPYTNIQQCANNQAPPSPCSLSESYQSTVQNTVTNQTSNTQVNILGCPGNNSTDYCYTYTGGVNDGKGNLVCMIQQTNTTRFSSTGQKLGPPISPAPSNNGPIIQYDPDTQAVRSKTPVELGLCVSTPPLPTCSAITTADSDSGYAIWPETTAGQQAQGQCPNGYIPALPLTRYCILDQQTLSQTSATSVNAAFEPLNGKAYCVKHYMKLFDASNNELTTLSPEKTEATITSTNGPFSIQNPYLCSVSNMSISNNNNNEQFSANSTFPSAGTWGNSSNNTLSLSIPVTNIPPTSINFTQYPQSGVWIINVPSMTCGPGIVLADPTGNPMYRFIGTEQFTFAPTASIPQVYQLIPTQPNTCNLNQITISTNGPGTVDVNGFPYNGDANGGTWSWFVNAWPDGLPIDMLFMLGANTQVTISINGQCQ